MAAPRHMTPEQLRTRGMVARLSQTRPADDPELLALKRELREGALAGYIKRTVDEAPRLTNEQLARLATLLAPRPDEADAAA